MPQGNFKRRKTQTAVPAKIKQKHQRASLGLKKGALTIAPKKARHQEAEKLKKAVERSIKTKVEKDVTLRATGSEAKAFKVAPSTITKQNLPNN